jgi:glycine/D-amino acid oxidase-like deaminating enzyme
VSDGTRVVVVGAGMSGLAAAAALGRAGARVRLLEARDRVGGRALTRWLPDGTQLDLGAQWIGPTQDRMYALVAYLGRLLAGGLLATGADEVSLLHLLFYLRGAGGTGPLLGMAGGAQQDRIVGGPPALAGRMAAGLPPGTLRLGAAVHTIAGCPRVRAAAADAGRTGALGGYRDGDPLGRLPGGRGARR